MALVGISDRGPSWTACYRHWQRSDGTVKLCICSSLPSFPSRTETLSPTSIACVCPSDAAASISDTASSARCPSSPHRPSWRLQRCTANRAPKWRQDWRSCMESGSKIERQDPGSNSSHLAE